MATNSPVLFKFGTRAEYNALAKKAENALYFLTDTGELLRGERNMAQANFYEGVRTQENGVFTETQNEAIARVTAGATLIKNDVCVIKELLFTESLSGENSYSHTAYVYDGSAWKAMDGNYNAENVYFDQDLTFTTNVGYVEIGGTGSETVETKGKNVKQVFEMLFSQEENPSVTQPSLSISTPQNKAYEVGTTVTPSYSLTFNAGNYEYGPSPTGVTATYAVTDTTGNTAQTTTSGTFPAMVVADDTAYYIDASATYTEGDIPVTNLGNPATNYKITAGTTTARSGKLYGYRQFFYGAMTAGTALNSANIRKLTNGGMTSAKTLPTYAASSVAGAAKVIVAIPASSPIGIKQVKMPSSQDADITTEFKLQPDYIQVEGKSGYQAVDYKVWVYEPAALDATESYTIILG